METLSGLTRMTLQQAVLSSMGAAITVTIMTIMRLPVSTSQAVVGAIMGIGIINRQVNFTGLGKVVACWLGTPLGGMVIAIIAYKGAAVLYNKMNLNLLQSDYLLRLGLVAAGAYGAYALGANNVANVTAVFVGAGHLGFHAATLVGGLSIGLGIMTFSRRVMDTVGLRLVRLDSFSALVVLLSEAITVHIYTFLGVPVSTSQAVIGAVLGVGILKGVSTVSRGTLASILSGWFFTPFLAGAITMALTFTIRA
jgi:PiT family inorganic phosphate transporter